MWGFFLKMVVADTLGQIVGPIFATPADHGGPMLLWGAVLFSWQVYFDFAADSDIAIGTALFRDSSGDRRRLRLVSPSGRNESLLRLEQFETAND